MGFEDREKSERIKVLLRESGLDGILVRLPENVLYFSNCWPITGWGAALILADDDSILFTPATEAKFTTRSTIADIREMDGSNSNILVKALKQTDSATDSLKIGVELSYEGVATTHLGYELDIPTAAFFKRLQKEFPQWQFVDATLLITELRAIKTPSDLQNLKLVNEITAFGLDAASQAVSAGISEIELASICERTINEKLIDYETSVDFIRAFAFVMAGPENGSRAGYPYNISSAYRMKQGELCMLELNTQVNGYWSDLTRTWVVGHHPNSDQQELIESINGAINAAVNCCQPGISTRKIVDTANRVIDQTRFAPYHPPFLGHGIGVKLHEPLPMLTPNTFGTMEQGHYFSLEPGIYSKEILGACRIERDAYRRF